MNAGISNQVYGEGRLRILEARCNHVQYLPEFVPRDERRNFDMIHYLGYLPEDA